MALSDFTGPDYIEAWTRDLDQRWPERAAMAECVVRTLVEWRDEWRSQRCGGGALDGERSGTEESGSSIRLLELGVGAGGLAASVLDALNTAQTRVSHIRAGSSGPVEYTGIEVESALARHVDGMLTAAGHPNVRLIRADLKDDTWSHELGPFDLVFTLQTIHDLGGVDALENVYRQIHDLLAPGGILVNADFVVPFEKDDLDRPRRLPVETHQDLLDSLGYVDFRCETKQGKMACMSTRRP